MAFEFATANQIVFGRGTLSQLGKLAAGMGRRALLVTGASPQRAESAHALLAEAGVSVTHYAITHEPTLQVIQEGVRLAQSEGCDIVVGFGGGSVVDAGKAISALLTNTGEVLDYLEVVGKGKPLTNAPASYIAVPTTAGTGAEVTRNAVISVPEERVKVSLRSPKMLPTVALVDPDLTLSLPPSLTASTGLDAFTQVMEPYVSNRATPMTDVFCRDGLQRASKALRNAYRFGEDTEAREEMALVSLFGGLALANGRLGAVHGFAAPLGGMFPAPHGAVCARLLPLVMETNASALREREPNHPALARYEEIAVWVTGKADSKIEDGIVWVQELVAECEIPPLSAYGITSEHLPVVVAKAKVASSMQGNPIALTETELTEILTKAL